MCPHTSTNPPQASLLAEEPSSAAATTSWLLAMSVAPLPATVGCSVVAVSLVLGVLTALDL